LIGYIIFDAAGSLGGRRAIDQDRAMLAILGTVLFSLEANKFAAL
jgi:hypothetical protein